MSKQRDRELGMANAISRRDFLNGVSIAVGASLLPAKSSWLELFGVPEPDLAPERDPSYYPPGKTGLRGSHDGSWEVAHALRDGKQWPEAVSDNDSYDLIVVGGGISGLSAAYFFRRFAGPQSKILILDNHDDFGGHAKRNEFKAGNRLLLGYGGTQSLEAPHHYSKVAFGLLQELGIDVDRFHTYFDQNLYKSMNLKRATFFDKETFGRDVLLPGFGAHYLGLEYPPEILAKIPIADDARRDLAHLQTTTVDYLAGLSPEEKRRKLIKTSYKDYLLQYVKVHPDVIKVFQSAPHGLYGVGIDGVSAWDCLQMDYPGFKGIEVKSNEDSPEQAEPYIFHFPDGNASVARLLVRSLVPGSADGNSMEDIVTARVKYAHLDSDGSPVRIRLNSTVVRAKHLGEPQGANEVEITYVRGGRARKVRAAHCVLACYNMVIPYLCPEMSKAQKEALSYAVKIPLVYTNVQIANWKPFQKLGLSSIYTPGGYFSSVSLDFPVSIGDYHFPSSPQDSCLLHLMRTPCKPGLPAKEQYRAGRWDLFTTKFDTFERNIRDQLGRMLAGSGFDPARDILAITVNRWPHGYAYEYNPLYEPLDRPDSERPCVIGRQAFGRIHIANSDADGHAYTNIAIDQGYRAVTEITSMHGSPAAQSAKAAS
ncbi:MAG TPA: NAD(P)-binding protein [Terriglobales bacterium]|nr:NAD(P)-binding protein [Terriglobales bacterium]